MKANRLAMIGILLGIAGAVLLALFVTSTDDGVGDDAVTVLVAGADGIAAGTRGEALEGAVLQREVPGDIAPARALVTTADVAGQRAARPIGPGEILTADQFAPIGPASGGVVVPAGWEAVSVEARPAPGLQGYATPGSLVNLYLTSQTPPEIGPAGTPDPATVTAFTQLVLGHTEVLAVTRGTLTGEASAVDAQAAQSPNQVFLLRVRPEDVPTLVHAEQQGELWFSLASRDDPPAPSVRITFDDLDPSALTQAIQAARAQLEQDLADEEAAAAAGPAEDVVETDPPEDDTPQ